MDLGLLDCKRHEDSSQHQEDTVIPSMFLRKIKRQSDSKHILQTTKSGDQERHANEKGQKPKFEAGHLLIGPTFSQVSLQTEDRATEVGLVEED